MTCGAAGASLEIDVGSLREMGVFHITLVLRSLPPSAAPETVPNPLAQMMTAARNVQPTQPVGLATILQVATAD